MNFVFGGFDRLSENYARARRGIPAQAISHIAARLASREGILLDLGCGTGISTRQIRNLCKFSIGVDPSKEMLREALESDCTNCAYAFGSAENIPFSSGYFDGVFCVSAFHWFANEAANQEINRVLKSGGSLIVVNKNEISEFRNSVKMLQKGLRSGCLPQCS